MKNTKEKICLSSFILPILFGCFTIAAAVSLIALIMTFKDIPPKWAFRSLLFVIGAGVFFTGFLSGMKIRMKGIISGAAAAFAVMLIITSIILMINSFKLNPVFFAFCPLYIVIGSVGGITASNLR